jgi:uncharacterized membrane protein YuzA (DUF378 family)
MKDRSTVQSAALLVGILLFALGVLGFVPGITTHYGDLSFAGHNSGAKLFGIFQTSILHNVVYLLFGLAGISMARSWEGGRTFLIGAGTLVLVLFVYGLLAHGDSGANFIPVNSADNVLHAALGIVMVTLGFVLGREPIPVDRGVA